jgi:hypothetical protein
MILKFPNSRCQECGSTLRGRMDKKFCNDVCRVRQHRRSHVKSSTVKEVEKVLIRNWSLLVSLKDFVKDEMTEESRMIWLRRKGFDFNFHTHVQPLDDGRLAIMCYEEGYILHGEGLTPWSDLPDKLLSRLPI